MGYIEDECKEYFIGLELTEDEIQSCKHYGTPRHSGRFPWGSGENPYQHNKGFYNTYRDLLSKGVKKTDIAKYFGMNTSQLKQKVAIEKMNKDKVEYEKIMALHEKGLGATAIGRKVGKSESTIRGIVERGGVADTRILSTADVLAKAVDKDKYIAVGKGVNYHLGISEEKLDNTLAYLKKKGYKTVNVYIPQSANSAQGTTAKVLVKDGTTYQEIKENRDKIRMVGQHSEDMGLHYEDREPIVNVDRKRIFVRYGDQGGKEKDGTIELRRGVDDIDLGKAHYAQVRIGVNGEDGSKLYMKGMAMYSDDVPKGYDMVYNTNKKTGAPDKDIKDETGFVLKSGVFKKQDSPDSKGYDPSNPFGAALKMEGEIVSIPHHYEDKDGNRHKSALNIVKEEGDWSQWKKNLPSQFLSKQDPQLAKRQLDLAASYKKDEYADIMSLTNPTIKRALLETFADECDSAAVHLKAAALPRQRTHVILPFTDIKDNEVYAPNYDQGEEVILVRFPHEGTFQIPRLRVNNHSPQASSVIGKNAVDAIGISSKTAETLSGADFDGDTCLVIPTKGYNLKGSEQYKKFDKAINSLKNFDPDSEFPPNPKVKPWKKGSTSEHTEMGKISNLITDMTVQSAPIEEVVRATKYSMLVIDVAKHHYDYKKAYDELGIDALKRKYQPKDDIDPKTGENKYGGAGTLISRAKSPVMVNKRTQVKGRFDPETGEKLYNYKPPVRYENGEPIYRHQKSKAMYEAKDARELSSGHVIENIYADYANYLKALGNEARKSAMSTPKLEYSPESKKIYAKQVASLEKKLIDAKKNAPLEMQAQALASKKVELIEQDNDLTKEEKKKEKNKAIAYARVVTGAKKAQVYIEDDEWQAIQDGAISDHKLREIWMNTDQDRAKELALPKERFKLSDAKIALISKMAGRYSNQEIADQLGISVSTVQKYL